MECGSDVQALSRAHPNGVYVSVCFGGKAMIRICDDTDFETIYSIINEAAKQYKGLSPQTVGKRLT